MGIGTKLYDLMEQRGTNANDLAKKIGVPPTTIYSMVKRDSKKADIEVLIRIARELGVELEYFSDDSKPAPQKPAYDEMITVYTKNRANLSQEEKIRLARIILSDDED